MTIEYDPHKNILNLRNHSIPHPRTHNNLQLSSHPTKLSTDPKHSHNAFKPIEKECRDRFQTNKTDRALRDRLDGRNKEEIERQVARWLKASRCADWVIHYSNEGA